MIRKRILAFVAGCLMLASVFMSTPIQISAKASGAPGTPSITVVDNNGILAPKIWLLSGSNNATGYPKTTNSYNAVQQKIKRPMDR